MLGRALARCVCFSLIVILAGCGSDDALSSPTAKRMESLGKLYLDYAVNKNGAGPTDEATLKKHIQMMPGQQLLSNGVNDPKEIDSLFKSDRDQEPLVVLYGTGMSSISSTSAPVVAHEKTGKNGKRLVVNAIGKVEVVDDAGLQALLTKKKE